MKRLISLIIVVILTTSLAGCVVVDEHYHRRGGPDAVIVTRPCPWPAPHYNGYYHRHWYGRQRY